MIQATSPQPTTAYNFHTRGAIGSVVDRAGAQDNAWALQTEARRGAPSRGGIGAARSRAVVEAGEGAARQMLHDCDGGAQHGAVN